MSKKCYIYGLEQSKEQMKKELVTPQDAAKLIYKGVKVTVEESTERIISSKNIIKLDVK